MPATGVELAGTVSSDEAAAATTVTDALPVTDPSVATMDLLPVVFRVVANAWLPASPATNG